jgi:hypothetical protein
MKSQSWQTRRQPNFATNGPRHPDAGSLPRRTGYELRNAAGAVLSSCDKVEPLMRNIGEKRDCVIVRCKDGVRVWPVGEAKESA